MSSENLKKQEKKISVLNAGKLSMIYKKGSVRYISAGRVEILRMIYSAVRDKNWLTITPLIEDEKVESGTDSFTITLRCLYRSDEINFMADYVIEGNNDNSLTLTMNGEYIGRSEKNRIGFCVLHPVEECAGVRCVIGHSDGSFEKSAFPEEISPHQPFLDIKKMEWQAGNARCSLTFSGDIFETEDQRNWTDASFKTYSTPLSLPFPVILNQGEKVFQKIELRVEVTDTGIVKEKDQIIHLEIDLSNRGILPQVGTGHSSRKIPLSANEIAILKKADLDHYRVDLHLYSPTWKQNADFAVNDAVNLGIPVEFVLFFTEDAINQAVEFTDWVNISHTEIALVTILDKDSRATPSEMADPVIKLIKSALPGVRTCCGTNANFAQLNRKKPESVLNDYICYSIHPQEHASDDTTLIENLKAQEYTVKSANKFAGGKGIWISPVTIQRRFNPSLTNFELPYKGDGVPPQVDARLMSLFGACWAAGSLKYLCESGVSGITYFETAGERGMIQGDYPSRWPEKFSSAPGMIFPVFHLLRFFLHDKSFEVIKSHSSDSLKADVIAISDGKHIKIIVINFTIETLEVIFTGITGEFRIRRLNAETFAEAASDSDWIENTKTAWIKVSEKILIGPFSLNFIDDFS
jgi:hypothetical protein